MSKEHLRFCHPQYPDSLIRESIHTILESNTLLSMATTSGGKPYIYTAYYCFNEKLHIYTLSDPGAYHSQNIANERQVAVAIYDSAQPWGSQKRGLQLFGVCEQLHGLGQTEALRLYIKRFTGLAKLVSTPQELVRGAIKSRFFRFCPNRIRIFDEPRFGNEIWVTVELPASK